MPKMTGSSGIFIGMDEAGYGPNLGPLVVTATVWETPGPPAECDFYELLCDVLSADGRHRSTRLHVADSKQVNTGKDGLLALETAALAIMACQGGAIDSFSQLCASLLKEADTSEFPDWYQEDLQLPLVADRADIDRFSKLLEECLEKSRIRLSSLRSDLVTEERFNRLTAMSDSKGLALSRVTFELLRSCWNPEDKRPTMCVGDKHGGRNRYDDLLAEVLDGQMIFRMEESRAVSRYRVGQTDLFFQTKGESHFPVAVASIVSKYLRELSMELLNRFWQRHLPGVRPTKGYPVDAKRFASDVATVREKLQITDEVFWRKK
ncbi:MAG: hypothetical protein KDA80_22440 [Planctomycetaceae bacterium]|nr:hypothetical protein [Planctomycetaceae bacterium]